MGLVKKALKGLAKGLRGLVNALMGFVKALRGARSLAEPHRPLPTETFALAWAVRRRPVAVAVAVAVAASLRTPVTPRSGSALTQKDLDPWGRSVAIVQHTSRPACRGLPLARTNLVPAGSRSQTLTLCSRKGLGFVTVGRKVAVPSAGICGVFVRSCSTRRETIPAARDRHRRPRLGTSRRHRRTTHQRVRRDRYVAGVIGAEPSRERTIRRRRRNMPEQRHQKTKHEQA